MSEITDRVKIDFILKFYGAGAVQNLDYHPEPEITFAIEFQIERF